MENNKIILQYIKDNLGEDLNGDYNELGCATCVNSVLKNCLGYEAGGGPSTAKMLEELKKNKNFKKMTTKTAQAGDIILSATGTGNGTIAHGHVGFLGENGVIYSNNSDKDMLDDHLVVSAWKQYFTEKGGFPVNYYRAIAKPLITYTPKPKEVEIPEKEISFRLDKFSQIALGALLVYLGTNLQSLTWTKAGLTTFGTGLVVFIIQALVKSFGENK